LPTGVDRCWSHWKEIARAIFDDLFETVAAQRTKRDLQLRYSVAVAQQRLPGFLEGKQHRMAGSLPAAWSMSSSLSVWDGARQLGMWTQSQSEHETKPSCLSHVPVESSVCVTNARFSYFAWIGTKC